VRIIESDVDELRGIVAPDDILVVSLYHVEVSAEVRGRAAEQVRDNSYHPWPAKDECPLPDLWVDLSIGRRWWGLCVDTLKSAIGRSPKLVTVLSKIAVPLSQRRCYHPDPRRSGSSPLRQKIDRCSRLADLSSLPQASAIDIRVRNARPKAGTLISTAPDSRQTLSPRTMFDPSRRRFPSRVQEGHPRPGYTIALRPCGRSQHRGRIEGLVGRWRSVNQISRRQVAV